jgi:hypothetical protein
MTPTRMRRIERIADQLSAGTTASRARGTRGGTDTPSSLRNADDPLEQHQHGAAVDARHRRRDGSLRRLRRHCSAVELARLGEPGTRSRQPRAGAAGVARRQAGRAGVPPVRCVGTRGVRPLCCLAVSITARPGPRGSSRAAADPRFGGAGPPTALRVRAAAGAGGRRPAPARNGGQTAATSSATSGR